MAGRKGFWRREERRLKWANKERTALGAVRGGEKGTQWILWVAQLVFLQTKR